MANVIGSRLHVIDTPDAGLIFNDQIRFISIRWVGAFAAGEVVEVLDSNDEIIWRSEATGANFVDEGSFGDLFFPGYKVPILGSGKLYIKIA